MLEQLRYDMITGLFHHKKRALLVIISVLLTYVFMCFSYRGLINTADFIKLLFSGMSYITDEKRFVIPSFCLIPNEYFFTFFFSFGSNPTFSNKAIISSFVVIFFIDARLSILSNAL